MKQEDFPGILSNEYRTDPYKFINHIAGSRELIFDPTLNSFICTDMAMAQRILSDSKTFSTEPLTSRAEPIMQGRVLAQMNGNEHSSLKRKFLSFVSRSTLTTIFTPLLRNLSDQLWEERNSAPEVDIMEYANHYALQSTFSLLGINSLEEEWISEDLHKIAHFATDYNLSRTDRDLAFKASRRLASFIQDLALQDSSNFGLISHLRRFVDMGDMSLEELIPLSLNILLAAMEPTDKTIGYTIHHLLNHPDLLPSINANPALLTGAVVESLRLTPPVHLVPRQVETPTILGDSLLNPGDVVVCHIAACNRDPAAFDDPMSFQIKRPGNSNRGFAGAAQHLSFGYGLHFCIGSLFAKEAITCGLTPSIQYLSAHHNTLSVSKFECTGIYTRGPIRLQVIRSDV